MKLNLEYCAYDKVLRNRVNVTKLKNQTKLRPLKKDGEVESKGMLYDKVIGRKE